MKPKLVKQTDRFSVSLFWRPVLLGSVGVVLGVAIPRVDSALLSSAPLRWMESVSLSSPEGARALLATGAGALATVLAVAFSITMVTQELAAGQYSPLVLRRFVADRVTQTALGIYLASIAYLLLAIRAVPIGGSGGDRVPRLTLFVGAVAIILCLGVIAHFIHHVARSVQVETIVRQVGFEAVEAVRSLPSNADGSEHDVEIPPTTGWPIRAKSAGYLQMVDEDGLLRHAPPGCRVMRVEMRAGDFVLPGMPLLTLWPARSVDDRVERALHDCISTGRERTAHQDVLFSIRELVDIALRALSATSNDPTTAIQALNELGAVNEAAMRSGLDSRAKYRLRRSRDRALLIPGLSLEAMLTHSFHEIPEAAGSNARVTSRLMEILANLATLAPSPEARDTIHATAQYVRRAALREELSPEGRRLLESRWEMVTGAMRVREGGGGPPAIH